MVLEYQSMGAACYVLDFMECIIASNMAPHNNNNHLSMDVSHVLCM